MNEMPEVRKEDIQNFLRLISWGARNYSSKIPKVEFDYDYFYSEGLRLLDKCMRFFHEKLITNPDCLSSYRKAKKPGMRIAKNLETIKKLDNRLGKNVSHPILASLAFSKYFRTALFRRFGNIRRMSFASKRTGIEIPMEEKGLVGEVKLGINGFDAVEYKELVEDVASKIDDRIERIIFLIKVNPPEDLCQLAIIDNRRKLKVGIHRRLRTGKKNSWGGKSVVVSDKNIRDFLSTTQGVTLSSTEYNQAFENVKKKVAELLLGGRG
jgi:hypothetical protein